MRGTHDRMEAGGGVEYLHRINDDASAFARGEVGYDSDVGLDYSVIGGVRWVW